MCLPAQVGVRPVIEKELKIINKLGLHARAAVKLVEVASRFDSHITLRRNGREVNGKSIMGVMMLAASQGTSIDIKVDGPDEADAMACIETLVRDRFGEDE